MATANTKLKKIGNDGGLSKCCRIASRKMPHPAGLLGTLFDDAPKCHNPYSTILSDGLRQFGEGLEQIESKASTIFLNAADNVAIANDVLHSGSMLANSRVIAALRHLPPRVQERFDGMTCAAEIYRSLLCERETSRVAAAAEAYSRIGDVLNFISAQPDIMACIAAHKTIEDAYALASVPAPRLHFKHITAKNCMCYFTCKLMI